jgi:glucose/mannose-6-phosphate isomerase
VKDEFYCGKHHSLNLVEMNLDDTSAMNGIDRSRMLSIMEKTHTRLQPPADVSTCAEEIERPRNIVFGGLGGSGIIGDIVTDYLRSSANMPVSVCRAMGLPAYVGENTLFVAISYSGETRETLSMFDQAIRKNAKVVTVSSGGKLISESVKSEIDYLRVPSDLLPRVALPELLAATLFIMGRAGVISDPASLLRAASEKLQAQVGEIGPSVSLSQNKAKQMAARLEGRLPLLFGSEEAGSVLRRFKNELNENSKLPAVYYTIPEAFHDDIEGLKMMCKLSHPQPIFLLDPDEGHRQRRIREGLYGFLMELGLQILDFEGMDGNRLERLLTAITFGDYVSVYLALIRGVDPSELELIPKFREVMRGT